MMLPKNTVFFSYFKENEKNSNTLIPYVTTEVIPVTEIIDVPEPIEAKFLGHSVKLFTMINNTLKEQFNDKYFMALYHNTRDDIRVILYVPVQLVAMINDVMTVVRYNEEQYRQAIK